jgi:hypothetical protein
MLVAGVGEEELLTTCLTTVTFCYRVDVRNVVDEELFA